MISASLSFPKGFLWGCATSAHQVEGENTNNDWWAWEQQAPTPAEQRSGLACDWWAGRWAEDFDLAAEGGQNAHRLSVEWSRVEPQQGRWDEEALTHYRAIVQGALARGLMPVVTLHHFSNPRWLAEQGGWELPEVVGYFEHYVRKVATALEDLVGLWVSINEPNAYAVLAYLRGVFPPGVKSLARAEKVSQHLALAHAAAYHALHELDPGCLVGAAHLYRGFEPARAGNFLDAWAARMRAHMFNQLFPRAFSDGKLRLLGRTFREPRLARTQDFYGLNYYTSEQVWFDLGSWRELFGRGSFAPDWDLSPSAFIANRPLALANALQWVRGFKLPIFITENGVEDHKDHLRPRYLAGHLRQIWKAANANWGLRGYFHWTLVDNFEWERGWSQRFGLHALDVGSQQRRKRPSADFYAAICRSNAISSEMVASYAPEVFDTLFPGGRSIAGLARAG